MTTPVVETTSFAAWPGHLLHFHAHVRAEELACVRNGAGYLLADAQAAAPVIALPCDSSFFTFDRLAWPFALFTQQALAACS